MAEAQHRCVITARKDTKFLVHCVKPGCGFEQVTNDRSQAQQVKNAHDSRN